MALDQAENSFFLSGLRRCQRFFGKKVTTDRKKREKRCVTDEKLLNLMQLADTLGVSYQFAKDASRAGLPLIAGRTTRSAAMEWFVAHPDFRAEARLARARAKKNRRPAKPLLSDMESLPGHP